MGIRRSGVIHREPLAYKRREIAGEERHYCTDTTDTTETTGNKTTMICMNSVFSIESYKASQ